MKDREPEEIKADNSYPFAGDNCDACGFDLIDPKLTDEQIKQVEREICPGCGRDLVSGKLAILIQKSQISLDRSKPIEY
jgi:hypothetical protein